MVEKAPVVSILLPVYNGEETLKATLDSLLSQSFRSFELLIGIDGTFDNSKNIALSYKDSRITIIQHPKNLGLAKNLNSLIEATHKDSQYLAMAEQDDIYVPERLQWQIALMETKPQVGLVSGIVTFKAVKGEVSFPGILVYKRQFPIGEDMFNYLYVNQLKVVNTCMLWRKSVHQKQKLSFRNTYGNFNVDWDFMLRFSLVSQIWGLQKVLAKMNRRIAGNSLTQNKKAQYQASRQLLKNFKKEFPNKVSAKLYNKALKYHRKVELGHHNKIGILVLSIYYLLRYMDTYFIKYLLFRIKKHNRSN